METPLERLRLLIQDEGLEVLRQSCVMVIGVGGVGGYAAEALARSGIGKLILIDADTLALSNLNRQIIATLDTVGQPKTEVMKQRIASYAPDCEVVCVQEFFSIEKEELFKQRIDYIVDAIDTLSSKLDCIELASRYNIPCISSLGMANRFDPSLLEVTTLEKTTYDPLARALRQIVKKRNFKGKIRVVFSREIPYTQNQLVHEDGITRKHKYPPASTAFVPSAAGLLCASYVFRQLLKKS